MTPAELRRLLTAVRDGTASIDDAAARLGKVAELGFATLDLGRVDRCGFPEVIFAEGKSAEWVEKSVRRLAAAGQDAFVTRVGDEQAAHLALHYPPAEQDRLARTFFLPASATRGSSVGQVCVVTAGTSDLPVAQEAAVTARVLGANAELIADVGVAGVHRVFRQRERLIAADVVIVVAGMDGALPSVVGGLVDCPVIAVPTSVGYGASFGGVAALLTMLNSCAAGVSVVNIDAGFKAGYAAALIVRRLEQARRKSSR
jgi:NCAIR mutase (PurE)-related protein